MSHPLPSAHQQRRLVNIHQRLFGMLDALFDDEIRRSRSVPASLAGPWRRTLRDAETILGPLAAPIPASLKPGDFCVSTLMNVHALQGLKRLHDKGFRRKYRESYPRSPERE